MDHPAVIIEVLNYLSLIDISRVIQVNKRFNDICSSQQYWQQRAQIFGVLNEYLSNDQIPDPRLRFVLAVYQKYKSDILNIFFHEALVELSLRPQVLVPKLVEVIGIHHFIKRAVKQGNINMVKYGMSLGPSPDTLRSATKWAADMDNKDLATYLSEITDYWIYTNAKYEPKDTNAFDDPNFDDHLMALFRYGHDHLANKIISEMSSFTRTIVPGVIDLLKRRNLSVFASLWERHGDATDAYDNKICPRSVELGYYVGKYGDIPTIDKYISGKECELDTIRREHEADRFISLNPTDRPDLRGTSLDHILLGATSADNLITTEHLLNKLANFRAPVKVKTRSMLDLLTKYDYPRDEIWRGVLRGGNYRLFFSIVNEMTREVFLIDAPIDPSPDMFRILIKETKDDESGSIRYPKMKLEVNAIHLLSLEWELLAPGRKLEHSPFVYNLCRDLGMWSSPKKIDKRSQVPEYVNLDLIPCYRDDLRNK